MCRTGSRGPVGNSWDVSGEQMCELLSTRRSSSLGAEGYVAAIPGLQCLVVRTCPIQAVGVSVPSFTDENITEGMTEQEEDLVKWAANAITIGT